MERNGGYWKLRLQGKPRFFYQQRESTGIDWCENSKYIGIIYPFEAHIVCNRRRTICVICVIWPLALLAGLPTVIFNTVINVNSKSLWCFCVMRFPNNHMRYYLIFKFGEFAVFYLAPLVLQLVLYCIITKHLFIGSEELHRPVMTSCRRKRSPNALQARKGVVKMLILSVLVYFLSYSPHQIMLFYNTISPRPFPDTWSFHVFVMVIAYLNSSANPVLYGIFSQNFRHRFNYILCSIEEPRDRQQTLTSSTSRTLRLTSLRSVTTEM